MLNIVKERRHDALTVKLEGRLDTTTAPALEKVINGDIGDAKNLVLDLKAVQYISSAGFRVLLGAQKKMQKIGSMKVVNVCEAVMEVFEMTGFADILVIE
jgi:anti-sigma B factor antagonist